MGAESRELGECVVILRNQVVRQPGEGLLYLSDAAAGKDRGGRLAVVERREVEDRDEDGGGGEAGDVRAGGGAGGDDEAGREVGGHHGGCDLTG